MKNLLSALVVISLLISGCASVSTVSEGEASTAKEFGPPSEGKAGVYIYRTKYAPGGALKKDVWIDGECIGESAPGVFFYHEVQGDKEHTLSTESEFSPNDLIIYTNGGAQYFVKQYIKMGAFVGGANLEQVDAAKAKEDISHLDMATKGYCSTAR